MRWSRLRASLLEQLPPRLRDALHRTRSALDPRRRSERDRALKRANELLRALSPLADTVAQGPFAQMRLPPQIVKWGRPAPYLIGSYEQEVHEHLERLLVKAPELVINIGAAEGYYAVGVARRLTQVHVVAIDSSEDACARCQRLAELNGVESRMEIRSAVSPEELRRLLRPEALIICDCEGCEIELLDPIVIPELHEVDIVVELHDHLVPDTARTILGRFERSHRTTLVRSRERVADPDIYPALRLLPPELWRQLLDETRPTPMQWAVLEHTQGHSGKPYHA